MRKHAVHHRAPKISANKALRSCSLNLDEVALMLLHANATVTICHSRTKDIGAEVQFDSTSSKVVLCWVMKPQETLRLDFYPFSRIGKQVQE